MTKKTSIDLRTCKKGDKLISSLGATLTYLRPTTKDEYLDHVVQFDDPSLCTGTRTHDGYVFRHNRIPEFDHDIVEITHQ